MKKIKVLHIHWKGHTGGAERFLRDIITYSNTDRFEHAICFLAQGEQLAGQLRAFNPSIFELGMKSGASIREGFKFLNVLKIFKPDIIHGHARNYFINLLLLFYPKLLKVYSEHGGGFEPTAAGSDIDRYEKFYRHFISRYNLVLTNAEYLREKILEWTKLADDQVKIYFYGIETTRYGDRSRRESLRKEWGISPEAKVVGIVGRLVEQKGIDDFIKIASEIQKSNKQCRFVVVGNGPLRSLLEKMAQDLNVEILFLGDRQDLPKLLPAFDIFVFTSRWEPFGIIILETLASGVPVVGFKVSGMQAIIELGGGAVLVDNRDHIQTAQEVIKLINDPKRYAVLVSQGRDNVEKNFGVKRNISLLEDEYCAIFEPAPNPDKKKGIK